MTRPSPLYAGEIYHVYNRGNNKEPIFRSSENYHYFILLYTQYIFPIADTYAYCLMNNHFHLCIRIREEDGTNEAYQLRKQTIAWEAYVSLQFKNLFSTYTKAFNKMYERTGSLFQKPFGRIHVDSDQYLAHLIQYIHQNPKKHGFVDHFSDWPYSSWDTFGKTGKTRIPREGVFDFFSDKEQFMDAHEQPIDEALIEPFIGE